MASQPERSHRQPRRGHIVAIGGGQLRTGETLPIDRAIVALTGRRHPQALFLPTASYDSPRYCAGFAEIYGRRLGCRVQFLFLTHAESTDERLDELITAADLIYVGGGNTLRMLKEWRRRGLDRRLIAAHERGAVLCGLSAGAICWFDRGHSDSLSFSRPAKPWDYIWVRGLALAPWAACPHASDEGRLPHVLRLLPRITTPCLVMDALAAVHLHGQRIDVLRARRSAGVTVVRRDGDGVAVEPLYAGRAPWATVARDQTGKTAKKEADAHGR